MGVVGLFGSGSAYHINVVKYTILFWRTGKFYYGNVLQEKGGVSREFVSFQTLSRVIFQLRVTPCAVAVP
jgi:hypothetical protein